MDEADAALVDPDGPPMRLVVEMAELRASFDIVSSAVSPRP